MDALEHRFLRMIRKFDPDMDKRTLLLAVSGGADSVALLRLCVAVGVRVSVAHLDHAVRLESAKDAVFVGALCKRLDVPFFMERATIPTTGNWEEAARTVRYAFLDRICKEIGADYIVLGHHRDDQAETVLLHLVRGAGLAGLSGMRTLSGNRYRPLLGVGHEELTAYLTRIGQPWLTDATNGDTQRSRAFVRHQIMPLLKTLNPRVGEAIARAAERLQPWADEERESTAAIAMEAKPLDAYIFQPDDFAQCPCAVTERADGKRVQVFDADAIQGAVFRARQSGDRLAPLGMTGSQKLTDVYINAKIDHRFRDALPVFAVGQDILWAVGVRPSRHACVTCDTQKAVHIAFRKPFPWENTTERGYDHEKS